MVDAVAPLSNSVQVGLRVPVILLALAGVVLILVAMRKIGPVAGVLGALGSLFIAIDQTVNILWVLHISVLADADDISSDSVASANNLYTIADAVLVTIGAALLVTAV